MRIYTIIMREIGRLCYLTRRGLDQDWKIGMGLGEPDPSLHCLAYWASQTKPGTLIINKGSDKIIEYTLDNDEIKFKNKYGIVIVPCLWGLMRSLVRTTDDSRWVRFSPRS